MRPQINCTIIKTYTRFTYICTCKSFLIRWNHCTYHRSHERFNGWKVLAVLERALPMEVSTVGYFVCQVGAIKRNVLIFILALLLIICDTSHLFIISFLGFNFSLSWFRRYFEHFRCSR